jgi:hypothetical protein
MDTITGPLPPDLAKLIQDLTHAIVDPVVGKGGAEHKAREQPLGAVKHLVPIVPSGKTLREEGANVGEVDNTSGDGASSQSSESASEPGASTTPAAGGQDAPPSGCSSQLSPQSSPVKRQASGANVGESGGPNDPEPSAPPTASGPGGDVGCIG